MEKPKQHCSGCYGAPASLSEADWLLKKHSPHWAVLLWPPVVRDCERESLEVQRGPGEASSCSPQPPPALRGGRDGRWELSPLLEVAGVVSSHRDNCSATSDAVINQDSCRHGAAVGRAAV